MYYLLRTDRDLSSFSRTDQHDLQPPRRPSREWHAYILWHLALSLLRMVLFIYTNAQETNKQPSSVVRAVNNPLQYSTFQPTYFYFYVRTYVALFPKVGSCQLGYDGPATPGPGTSRLPNFGLGKGPSPPLR